MYGLASYVLVFLTIGNYLWQTFTKRDWETAAERSFFQGVALVAYLLSTAFS